MGKFVSGVLLGVIVGTIFSENFFPDGFSTTLVRLIHQILG